MPAFLRNAKAAAEVDTHRAYMAAALEQELTPCRFPYHSIRIQRIHVRSFRRPGVPGIGPHHTQ